MPEQSQSIVQLLDNAGEIAFAQIGQRGLQEARVVIRQSRARIARQLSGLYVGQPSSRQRLLLDKKPQHVQVSCTLGKAATSLEFSVGQLCRQDAKEILVMTLKKIICREAP
jgi:hypothetical protein